MKLSDLIKEEKKNNLPPIELDVVKTDGDNVKYVTKDGRYEIHPTNVNPATGEIGKRFWRIWDVADGEYWIKFYKTFDDVKDELHNVYHRQGVESETEAE